MEQALGGQSRYKGRNMFEAHKNLGINDYHYDIIVDLLLKSLAEYQVGKREIQEINEILESVRSDIALVITSNQSLY